MTDITPYTPLRRMVAFALDEEDRSIGHEDKYWLLGLRALTELNYDISAQPKTIELIVDSNKTARWPSDCLSWSKVGLRGPNGELSVLKINNALTTYRDNWPTRISDVSSQVDTADDGRPIVPFYNYYYAGGCFQLFGFGGGMVTYGDCKVDDVNRVIIFPPDFGYSTVLFEYTTAPERDIDYQVPTYLQEAVVMFIRAKDKRATMDEFYGEVIKARRRQPKKKVVLQSFNQVIRETGGMYLKS